MPPLGLLCRLLEKCAPKTVYGHFIVGTLEPNKIDLLGCPKLEQVYNHFKFFFFCFFQSDPFGTLPKPNQWTIGHGTNKVGYTRIDDFKGIIFKVRQDIRHCPSPKMISLRSSYDRARPKPKILISKGKQHLRDHLNLEMGSKGNPSLRYRS